MSLCMTFRWKKILSICALKYQLFHSIIIRQYFYPYHSQPLSIIKTSVKLFVMSLAFKMPEPHELPFQKNIFTIQYKNHCFGSTIVA